jgi:hypothetical protein
MYMLALENWYLSHRPEDAFEVFDRIRRGSMGSKDYRSPDYFYASHFTSPHLELDEDRNVRRFAFDAVYCYPDPDKYCTHKKEVPVHVEYTADEAGDWKIKVTEKDGAE